MIKKKKKKKNKKLTNTNEMVLETKKGKKNHI